MKKGSIEVMGFFKKGFVFRAVLVVFAFAMLSLSFNCFDSTNNNASGTNNNASENNSIYAYLEGYWFDPNSVVGTREWFAYHFSADGTYESQDCVGGFFTASRRTGTYSIISPSSSNSHYGIAFSGKVSFFIDEPNETLIDQFVKGTDYKRAPNNVHLPCQP